MSGALRAGRPFLLLEHGGKTEVSVFCEQHQIRPQVCFTTWDDYAIMSMAESGQGIGILPSLILRRVPYQIAVRPLTVPAYREIGIALKDRRTASQAMKEFLRYLEHFEPNTRVGSKPCPGGQGK
ncbi:MAG: LysR family transcriptional regulator substrate-binding protein [Anaerovoracaceae bacterium]